MSAFQQVRRYQLDLSRYYRLPQTQISLGVVLSLVLVSFFGMFALRPTLVSIATLNKSITDSQKTLTQLEAKVKALQTASAKLESLRDTTTLVDYAIPTGSAGYAELSSLLTYLASQSGVTLASLTTDDALLFAKVLSPYTLTRGAQPVPLVFSVRVTGSYPAVHDYLVRLLTSDRITRLTSLTYAKEVVGKTTSTAVSLTIAGEAYYTADLVPLQKILEHAEKGL